MVETPVSRPVEDTLSRACFLSFPGLGVDSIPSLQRSDEWHNSFRHSFYLVSSLTKFLKHLDILNPEKEVKHHCGNVGFVKKGSSSLEIKSGKGGEVEDGRKKSSLECIPLCCLVLNLHVNYHECAARSSWKSSFLPGTDGNGCR